MALLNTATSIVDFLKSRGFTTTSGERIPLYDFRKQLYSTIGGTDEFIGSSTQNIQLLNYLKNLETNTGVSITPDNIFQSVQATSTPTTSTTAPVAGVQNINQFLTSGSPAALAAAGETQTETFAPTSTAPTAVTTATTPETELQMPADLQERINQILNPLAGRDVGKEAIEAFTGSPLFPLQQEAVGAQKAAIQLSAQRETEKFIKNIASRGLFFSGAKTKGVNEIEVDKMSKLLNVDRRFAMLIVQGLESAAQAIAKEAQKGSENALAALEKLGFTINPLTGRIEPTAAERRFQQTEERLRTTAEATQERFEETQTRLISQFDAQQALREAQFDLSQAKTEIQLEQAQARLELAQANYELAVQREQRIATDAATGGSGAISLDTAKKYNLPTTTSKKEFSSAYNIAQGFRTGLTAENYFDLWGKAADKMQSQGINPETYNALLWELFHPEGIKGYYKYILGQTSGGGSILDEI